MIQRSHRDTVYEQACTPTLKTNQLVFLYNQHKPTAQIICKQTTETNSSYVLHTRQTHDLIHNLHLYIIYTSSTQTSRLLKETTDV